MSVQNILPYNNSSGLANLQFHRVSPEGITLDPDGQIAGIWNALERGHAVKEKIIAHFCSAYIDEGAGKIGFDTACAASVLSSKKVLCIDCTDNYQFQNALAGTHSIALDVSNTFASEQNGLFYLPVNRSEISSLFFTNSNESNDGLLGLTQSFDVIIIVSEGGVFESAPIKLSSIANATVVVIQAERTRIPVVQDLQARIKAVGGKVVGAVLNKRRQYIPQALYSLLFRK